MYAIFKDGGHQYRAQVGQRIYVEYREVEKGQKVEFDEVLLLSKDGETIVGQPTIPGAKVVGTATNFIDREVKTTNKNGEVVETSTVEVPIKGPKVVIRWFRRRKNSRRKNGHRQLYTLVTVTAIEG